MFDVTKAPEIRERKKVNCKASYFYVFYISPFLINSKRTMPTLETWRRKKGKNLHVRPGITFPSLLTWARANKNLRLNSQRQIQALQI